MSSLPTATIGGIATYTSQNQGKILILSISLMGLIIVLINFIF
jgi:hypothetical protein